MVRDDAAGAMEAALSAAGEGNDVRYALVNRPACFASLPKGLSYQVEARPAKGAAHHDYARHGVLVSSRRLTAQEMRDFELAYMIDAEQSAQVARVVVEQSLGERAQNYLDAYEDDSSLFRQGVMQEAEGLFAGLRVSFQDNDGFIEQVLKGLRCLATERLLES